MMPSMEQLTPEIAPQYARILVGLFSHRMSSTLDYSSASLAAVDDFLEDFHELEETWETRPFQILCCGCYVGEVFVRTLGAEWKLASETGAITRFPIVVVLPSGTVVNPIGKALKLVENGREDSTAALYNAVAAMKTEPGTASERPA